MSQLPSGALCGVCRAAVDWSKAVEREVDDHLRLLLHSSFEALADSASRCPLCAIIFHDAFKGKPFQSWDDDDPLMQRRHYLLNVLREHGLSKVYCEETFPDFPHSLPNDGFPTAHHLVFPSGIGSRAIWQSDRPAFADRLRTVAEWISDCDASHELCKDHVRGRPKRLLDLSLICRTGRLKLVMTAELAWPVRYATLSHCWGSPTSTPPLQTKAATLQAHMLGISPDSLPANFRDAAFVAGRLGLDYLWIDSLCIIQDDAADWESEAANMADIYLGSYINIAASASEDAHGGIIGPASAPSESRVTRVRAATFSDSMGRADVAFMVREDASVPMVQALSARSYRYYTRAWVFQELALSPRTVHFPKGQLLWQCRHCSTTEDGTFWSPGMVGLGNGDAKASSFKLESGKHSSLLWAAWVDSYTTRNLTFAADVGPAAAGLVSYFRSRTGRTPMLGLWRETFALDLQWSYRHPMRRMPPLLDPSKGEFPSWSWLSVLPSRGGRVLASGVEMEVSRVSLRIEDWEVRWAGPELVSRLVQSRLEVSSLVRAVALTIPGVSSPDDLDVAKSYHIYARGEPSWTGICDLQYFLPASESRTVTLLHLSQGRGKVPKGYIVVDSFIILLPRPENPRQFYRIGSGSVQSSVPFAEMEDGGSDGHWDIHFKASERQTLELV